eukprot:599152-Hanusia_phi.AAC.1
MQRLDETSCWMTAGGPSALSPSRLWRRPLDGKARGSRCAPRRPPALAHGDDDHAGARPDRC